MSKCVIIAPLYRGEEADWLRREAGDILICADGGYAAAVRQGLEPDLMVGDFDSLPANVQPTGHVLRLPVRKDDTDMVVCLQEGRRRGYRAFRIAGALGGRLDHTLANIQCLYDCALRGEEAWLCDENNRMTVLTPGAYTLPAMAARKLSLLAYTPEVEGVTLRGTSWELENHTLTSSYPLGVSNEVLQGAAELSFDAGALMVVYAKDS